MKQLLIILTIIFAIPFSDVFAQHVEPLPNAVLKMDGGYSIKGNKVTAIDKTTLSTKNTSVPSSQAVQTAINSALTTTGNFYKVNPTVLYEGITNLDTNVIRYGTLLFPANGSILSTLNTPNIIGNKTTYIDHLKETVASNYTIYKIEVSSLVMPSNMNIEIKRVTDSGIGLFACRTPNSASTPGSYVKAKVGYYESDSLLQVASSYNNNALVYLKSQQFNAQYDFDFETLNIFGWTVVFAPLTNMTNCSFNGHIGKLKQFLPYSILGGDNGKSTLFWCVGGQTITNSNITIVVDEADLMDNGIEINAALVNSRIIVKVKNCRRTSVTRFPVAAPLITIAGSTDATSQIVIEGDFYTSTFEVVDIQANMNVLLKGTFETASTTKGAIKLSTSAANVKLQGLLKTGHTESITAAGAYSISVLPGSAANKAVGASVTQVGGTITVNAGY